LEPNHFVQRTSVVGGGGLGFFVITSSSRQASLVSQCNRGLTSAALLTIAGLHVAWGFGSSFPFRDRVTLADCVVGGDDVPSRSACLAVGAALTTASALAADWLPLPRHVRTRGLRVMAAVLGIRGVLGLFNKTALVSPGSDSPRFQRLDRTVYAPLCVILAIEALFCSRES
jgi:hypothetical protein